MLPFPLMLPIQQALQEIPRHWLPLQFDPAIDLQQNQTSAVQTYFDYYQLQRFDALAAHAFGYFQVHHQTLAAHYWLPENPVASLFVLHGYYDHVGLFGHAIEFGLNNNFAVFAFDFPGHGLSSGEPATIDDFGEYTAALDTLIKKTQSLNIPGQRFALAQSTGCAVLLKYQLDCQASAQADRASGDKSKKLFDAQVLLAPLVRPHGWQLGRIAHWLLRPLIKTLKRSFALNSHDEKFLQFLAQDPLQSHILSLRWITAMKLWLRQMCRADSLAVPTLIVQGKEDTTVDWPFNIPLLCARLPRHEVFWLEHGRHQLINESASIRQKYLAAAAQFLNDQRTR